MTTDTRNLRLFLEGRFVDRLNVVSFRGVEEANRLYRIDVEGRQEVRTMVLVK